MRRITMAKGCLYCGLQLPDTTRFCPQCGRPIEDAIRVESGVKMRRITMAKGCLYCGLQLPDTTRFCPQCGRPIERGLVLGAAGSWGLTFHGLGKDGHPKEEPSCLVGC